MPETVTSLLIEPSRNLSRVLGIRDGCAHDGDAMAAGTRVTLESYVASLVYREAVVLVLDVGAGDVNTSRRADVESVGVVAEICAVAGGVVDGDIDHFEVLRRVDREALDGRVFDV